MPPEIVKCDHEMVVYESYDPNRIDNRVMMKFPLTPPGQIYTKNNGKWVWTDTDDRTTSPSVTFPQW